MTLLLALGIAVATAVSFFFSGVETGIYAMNRVRLRLRAEEGDSRAVRILELVRRPQLLISSILIGNHVANFAASFFCMRLLLVELGVADPELANTIILTPFLFVFGEITPKNVFRLRSEDLVYRSSRLLAGASVLFRPLALALRWFGRATRALPQTPRPLDAVLSRDRIGSLVRDVTEEGVLTPEQSRMVANVMRLSSIPVREAMVPWEEVDTVPEGFETAELIAASGRHRRSRLPVVDRGSGRPVGVVNALDLVYREAPDPAELVRPVPVVSSLASVDQALRTLLAARQPMGFVSDRSDETVGVVTVKDLVEEVSGELPAF